MDRFKQISIIFLLLQILVIFMFFKYDSFLIIFYFCYNAPILFAYAFYTKNILFIRTLINLGLIGQVVWILDFISYFIFKVPILGNSIWIFEMNGIIFWAVVISHISTIFALYLSYKLDMPKGIIKNSFFYVTIIYFITLLFIPLNINFIREFEGLNIFPLWTLLYLVYIFPIILWPTYFIQKSLQKIKKKSYLS